MPAVTQFMASGPMDLGREGTKRYAELLDRPMVGPSEKDNHQKGDGPKTVGEFEAMILKGHAPTQHAPTPSNARAIDRVESLIVAAAWAREKFIEPPKAAKYVSAALWVLSAMLVGSIVQVGVFWNRGS